MKRAYVKPFMDSESFIANEYIATCYVYNCKNCYNSITLVDKKMEAEDLVEWNLSVRCKKGHISHWPDYLTENGHS